MGTHTVYFESQKFTVINKLKIAKLFHNDKLVLQMDGVFGLGGKQRTFDEKLDIIEKNENDLTKDDYTYGRLFKYKFNLNGNAHILCVYHDVTQSIRNYLTLFYKWETFQFQINGKYLSGHKYKVQYPYDLTNDLTEEDSIRHAQGYENKNKSDEVSFKVVRKVKDN